MRALLAVAVALAVAASAVAQTGAVKVTNKGVGGVKLGKRHSVLYERGLVGRLRKGCELAGPGTRSSRLRKPLTGTVNWTRRKPRRVRSVLVSEGAAAKGVGIGATRADIEAAFPHARFDESTQEIFQITLVTVPKRDGGRFQFALDADSGQVSSIGVPFIAFCE